MDNNNFICLECNHELEFMMSYHEEDCLVELYNCDNCGSAWKIKKTDKGFGEIERYFFG